MNLKSIVAVPLFSVVVIACTVVSPEAGTDYEVQTDDLSITQVGDTFRASFHDAEVYAEATRVSPKQFQLRVTLGDSSIQSVINLHDHKAEVTAIGDNGGEFILTAEIAKSLEEFSLALENHLPTDSQSAALGNRLYRLTAMYARHPVGEVVTERTITPSKERGLTNLCWYYHGEREWTALFDYEFIRCEWYGCYPVWRDGTWTGRVGADANCYGRCGAGCSSGSSIYSVDCANHDGCLNAGHSEYQCLDEFDNTVDDWTFGQECD